MSDQAKKAAILARAQSDAARRLFTYLYIIRFEREPFGWEKMLGAALLTGEFKTTRPSDTPALRDLQTVADAVEAALGIVSMDEGEDD